ncbi:MAG: peptide chain release factor 1, partial [Bacteroidales bacterium]
MLEKLSGLYNRFKNIEEQMNHPEVMADMKKFIKLNKDYKELQPIVFAYKEYKNVLDNIASAKEILKKEKDEEFREMAKVELAELNERRDDLEEKIRLMLIPKDPQDEKNAIVEIRAGTGGDEASLFAGDLYRMYTKYCETKNWKIDLIDFTEGTAGGFKEIIFDVSGDDVYGQLKYESGVHRVQRVPKTETQGRVHTSAASVVVLPEAEEVDVEVSMNDIRKDTFCSSGPGGQSVNTTYSAIRLTH